ncbi:MAG: helix-turn-helix domain-containing protein [Gammaproteobacteria bacterium]
MAQSAQLIEALKASLKAQGLTYADVARSLKLSEASIKRCFSEQGFTLERLEQICGLAGLEISDLVELAAEQRPPFTSLTPEQEEALLQDPKLLLMTFLVLSHWQFADILKSYQLTEHEAIQLLSRLDRLGLIDLLPGNRIKLLTARNFSWRKDGPMQQFFEREVLRDFLASRFNGARDEMKFVGGLLSWASLERVQQGMNSLAREFNELVAADSKLPLEERFSCAALFAARPWVFSHFSRLEKPRDPVHSAREQRGQSRATPQ